MHQFAGRQITRAAILCCLAAAPLAAARADWEYTRWGMTPEQVEQASRGAVKVIAPDKRAKIIEAGLVNSASGSHVEGTLRFHVAFNFDINDGGLVTVGYGVLDPNDNERLISWLMQKYGSPQSTGGLPAIGLSTLDWSAPDEISLLIAGGQPGFVLQSRRR